MGLVVGTAAVVGMLSSIGLLRLGVEAPWLRYVIAASAAYAVLLGLVRLWLRIDRRAKGPDSGWVDILDVGEAAGDLADAGYSAARHAASNVSESSAVAGGDYGGPDLDLPGEELLLVVALAAAVLAGVVAAAYVVVIAPSFFAEVLVDGALSYGLYRRVRGLERRYWLTSAVARTWKPFAAVILCLACAGFAMRWYDPAVDSIGDLWRGVAR